MVVRNRPVGSPVIPGPRTGGTGANLAPTVGILPAAPALTTLPAAAASDGRLPSGWSVPAAAQPAVAPARSLAEVATSLATIAASLATTSSSLASVAASLAALAADQRLTAGAPVRRGDKRTRSRE